MLPREHELMLESTHGFRKMSLNVPDYFKRLYKSKSELSMRNKCNFVTSYYKTAIGQRDFDFILAMIWNKLPNNIKSVQNQRLLRI